MELTKEFVNSCRKVAFLRDFLCQAIDQVDEKDKEIAELKESYKDMDVTHTVHIAKMNARIRELEDNVNFWKKKLDDEMASRRDEYEKSEKEIRRLKRALWIAHEYKAKFKRWWLHLALDCEASLIRPNTKTINRIRGKIGNCEKSERKCRAKAEEYK